LYAFDVFDNQLTKHHLTQDPNEALTDMLDYMKTSAAKTVGELKRGNSTQHTADPTFTKLSGNKRHRDLRSTNTAKVKTSLPFGKSTTTS